jgi:hypothetical protein
MDMKTSVIPAKYLARTMFKSEIGLVNNNSIVPDLRSSAIIRMVIAGIRIMKIKGVMVKKGIRLDSLLSNKLAYKYLLFGINQCNSPEAIR